MQDYDAIPVCGFSWIHWTIANIDPKRNELPENASRTDIALVQEPIAFHRKKSAAIYRKPLLNIMAVLAHLTRIMNMKSNSTHLIPNSIWHQASG